MTSLVEQADGVSSRESFLRFVASLREDFITNSAQWENDKLDSFLEAIGAWTSDMDGYFRNRGESLPEEPSWKIFAQILYAAKSYE